MRYMMFICLLLPLLLKSQDATPVFVSGQEGHKVYRIPAVIGLPNGNLLAFAEGRVQNSADFGDISVMSVYHPSGSSGEERQNFKMNWLSDFQNYIDTLKKQRPKLVICGDYNICHQAIDIHDPKGNAQSSGFLPEERAWIGSFIESGFVDSFRYLNKDPHNYTWWTFRAGARGKNKGWRIDYCMVSKNLESNIEEAEIYPDGVHSDHCGLSVTLDI